jgi:hypothetical protein
VHQKQHLTVTLSMSNTSNLKGREEGKEGREKKKKKETVCLISVVVQQQNKRKEQNSNNHRHHIRHKSVFHTL